MATTTKKFRTAYGPRVQNTGTSFIGDLGHTIQEQKQQTDINYILDRYRKTGIAEHVQQNEPQYGEFKNFDFQEMQNKVVEVKNMFDKLPAKERAAFDHDPQQFLNHIQIVENVEDMRDGTIDNPIVTEEATLPSKSSGTASAENQAE